MGQRTTRVAWTLLASLAAGEARAQSVGFGPPLSTVPPRTAPVQVALAPWSAPPAIDLFVAEPRADGSGFSGWYRRGDLAPFPLPWSLLPPPATPLRVAGSCFTAGSWAGPGLPPGPGDGLADIAWCASTDLRYRLSPDQGADGAWTLKDPQPTGLAFARLLDRADLVLAIGETQWIEIAPGALDSLFTSHTLYYPPIQLAAAPTFALQPLRLGTVARGRGLHDLAWTRVGRPDVYLLWTLLASSQPALGNWDGQLLTFGSALEVRGVGAVDVLPLPGGDGIPDLLAVVVPTAGSPRLLAVQNPGTPQSFTPSSPVSTVDVGAGLGLSAPAFAAPLDLDGVPAAAVFDGGAAPRLHVVTANPGGGLRSWSTAVDPAWGTATQVLAADLVGSPAADLVAVFANGTTGAATIRVWPGDLPPSIAWAPGPPPASAGTASQLVVSVDASDPDGTLTSVDLRLQGLSSGIVPVQVGTRYTFTIPTARLCALRPTAHLAVRATDDLGVWREVTADVALSDAPALALDPPGSTQLVPLLPGGTSAALSAAASDGCGRPVTLAWTASGLPAGASSAASSTTSPSVLTVAVPEAAYPAMVAGPGMAVPVTVTATATGSAPASAQVTLAFDASGLVAAEHRSDRASLAPGELALLTTTLRSRIGVALPQVALVDRLSGLVAAGPPRASGAQLLATAEGPDGLVATLDQIPGGGAPVVVELPVRLAGGTGGSSRAQAVAAASGVPLSAGAEASAPRATAAGIACGSGGGSPAWVLGLLLYMKAMRRVPARTRSTSSRTPMSRQA